MNQVQLRQERDGQVARVILDAPKANILDMAMIAGLREAFAEIRTARDVKALVIEGAGRHFSYGASVPEHQAGPCREMIPAFGRLFAALIEAEVPTLALVRGQCLGGGMELAVFCNWVFAEPGARFGQPEIRLGVFPPVAALILPALIGQPAADDLCLTGRSLTAEEAHQMGLVYAVAEDGEAAVQQFLEEHLLPKSAAALRIVQRAARQGFHEAFLAGWARMERLYLEELMATGDANEGIAAFMENRPPRWRNR